MRAASSAGVARLPTSALPAAQGFAGTTHAYAHDRSLVFRFVLLLIVFSFFPKEFSAKERLLAV